MSVHPRIALSGVAFFLTGVGTALLGATLPATLHQWHLSDSRGGVLLLAGWGGSTSGALLARGNLEWSAPAGLVLSSLALFALSAHPRSALPGLYLLYGLGLGLTMTAISLVRSRNVPSQRADIELNRLNLIWAAGACTAPTLALRSLHLLSVAFLYRLVGGLFLLSAAASVGMSLTFKWPALHTKLPSNSQLTWAPLRFGLYAAASVGLESAVGSWLTTFAQRSTSGVVAAVSANSAFWLGLLLSRAAHSVEAFPWFHTPNARRLHVAAIGFAMTLLLLFPDQVVITFAGLLCGFGLGPLYPYVLSLCLPRFRSNVVFIMAGVGASVVPWLTGVLSSAGKSLRIGLLAPAATWILLLICSMALKADRADTQQTFPL